jgi:hypothetical protein
VVLGAANETSIVDDLFWNAGKGAREPDPEHDREASDQIFQGHPPADEFFARENQQAERMSWQRLHMDGLEEDGASQVPQAKCASPRAATADTRQLHDGRLVWEPLRNHRVSSFRRLPQSAKAPTPNCLDFGWRCRRLQKSGSLARTCGNGGLSPQLPRTAGRQKLIAAAES